MIREHGEGARVRSVTDVVGAGAATVYGFYEGVRVGEREVGEVPEDALGHGRPADVTETDEEDGYGTVA